MGAKPASGNSRWNAIERLKHLAWAGTIALVLHLATLLVPLDQVLRTWQYWLSTVEASGDIAFVGAGFDVAEPSVPTRREDLARMVERLDRAGAREIYVDVVFDRPSNTTSDTMLNQALRATRGRAQLIENIETAVDGSNSIEASIPAISRNVPSVGGQIWTNFLGYAWHMPYMVAEGEKSLASAPLAMSGMQPGRGERFPISYYFELSSIPSYRFERLIDPQADLSAFAGKTVVIGAIDPPHMTKPNIPGMPGVPPSLLHIYAAETLKAGHIQEPSGLIPLGGLLLLICLAAFFEQRRWRNIANGVACLALPVAIYATALMAVRLNVAAGLAALVIYGGFRARATWRRGFQLVDAETNLPTFAALEADRLVSQEVPALIVARIHHFEEVRRTLPKELHTEYLLRIISRLTAATQDAVIYLGKGSMLAWTMPEKDSALVREHLEGLRALFSAPLMVGNNPVDVGITFGVDVTTSPNVTRRLAAAVSAAEQTTETYEPIVIAESASDEDLIWNISIQARIDAALANGEIYLVFQPKVSVQTGALLGVEALVRWNDPVRGHIPPDQFIRQCENAGRMAQLTRHVLTEACKAGNEFARQGIDLAMAVNISATQLHERRIVHEVRDVLRATGYPPHMLVLEITETYRISNLDRAAEILSDLASMGAKISMDDFGVGAASLEALVRLPFSEIKIDRMFVARSTSDPKAAGIVRSVLALGQDLRITVVAEGVEDAQTLNFLRNSGCQVAQGFGISRPVGFSDIVNFHTLSNSANRKFKV